MPDDKAIISVLQKYLEIDEKVARRISDELAAGADQGLIETSKERILRQIELHAAAHEAIEEEVTRFREELYSICKAIAAHDMERNIITESHVIRARHKIWRGYQRISLTDGFLTVGSLLVGAAVPHILALSSGTPANIWLLGLGVVGGIFLGMGLLAKAKGS